MSNQEMAQKGINLRDRHLESRAVLDVFTHPAVVERIAQLLGPDLLIWRSQFFPKGPGEGGTAWHQASVYMLDNMLAPTVQPPDLRDLFQLTVWVAITDATIEGGALRIVPGTNKEIYPQLVEDFDPTKHEHEKEARFGTKILKIGYPTETAKIVDIPMKAGEFFIFSERTIHGALPNVTKDVHRLGMSARYITPGTKCYNPLVLNKTGLDFSLLRLKGLNMDRWRAVVVRGKDTIRANGDRTVTLEDLQKEQAGAAAGVAA
jgi:chlorinating enzyme